MKDTNVITLKSLPSLGSTFTPSEDIELYFTRTSDCKMGKIKLCSKGYHCGKFLDDFYAFIDGGVGFVIDVILDGTIREPTKLELYLAGVEDEHR
jgi:hypothetical protein